MATPLRGAAETLGITESPQVHWKRHYEQQGDDSRPEKSLHNAGMECFLHSMKAERVYLTPHASYHEEKPACSTKSANTITAVATRHRAISIRWNLIGAMGLVALCPSVPGQIETFSGKILKRCNADLK